MPHPMINAFTAAAFALLLLGILKPLDFLLVLLLGFIAVKAAPGAP
ncbi:MAG: hypothetical protein V1717_04250 [Candidatus Micrarchaeota archaeon]